MGENSFGVDSVCDEIVSTHAQPAHDITFEKYPKIPNQNAIFE
jgi:hypothetical protein